MNTLKQKLYITKRVSVASDNDGNYRLIMSLHFMGKRLIFYPGIYLEYNQWDKNEQQFINSYESEKLNKYLSLLMKESRKIYLILLSKDGLISTKEFLNLLSKFKYTSQFDISEAMISFIEDNYENWSNHTYLKFKSLYQKLKEFLVEKSKYRGLEFVDSSFLKFFSEYLRVKGMADSTLKVAMNNMKWFLNFCLQKNWMINNDFKNYSFHPIENDKSKGEVLAVYLNENQLSKLYNAEIENRRMEQCRDIFCFMVYTGIRFSELNKLKKVDWSDGSIYIHTRTEKKILLNDFANKIISSYRNRYFINDSIFPVYSIITVNKYLNLLFDILNIIPGKKEDKSFKKISVNLAYNTFMANAIFNNISPFIIRKWSENMTMSRYAAIKDRILMEEKESINQMNSKYER